MGSTRRIIGRKNLRSKWVFPPLTPEQIGEIAQWRTHGGPKPLSVVQREKLRLFRERNGLAPEGAREMSVDERISFVTAKKGVRLGPRIRLNQLQTVPIGLPEETMLKRALEELSHKGKNQLPNARALQLTAKIDVLSASILVRRRTGRDPTLFQILAQTVIKEGPDSPKVIEHMRALRAIFRSAPGLISFVGDPSTLYNAVIRRDPSGRHFSGFIEELLHRKMGKILSTVQIADFLGVKWESKGRDASAIRACLHLLEAAGLVKKYPMSAQSHFGLNMWAHAGSENPVIDYDCVPINLMESLSAQPVPYNKLFHGARNTPWSTTGYRNAANESARFNQGPVKRWISVLRSRGIIDLFDASATQRFGVNKVVREKTGITRRMVI